MNTLNGNNLIIILLILSGCYAPEIIKPKEQVNNVARLAEVYTPKTRVYIVAGQSNAGKFTTLQLGRAEDVKCWNYFSKKYEPYIDVSIQFFTNKGGVIVPLAKNLRAKYPNDSLYFIQFHKGGTDLGYQWNVKNRIYFKHLVNTIDAALVPADEINFIWIQGEKDARILSYANSYEVNEKALFDSLQVRYNVNRFINYVIPTTLPEVYLYKQTVRDAKHGILIDGTGMHYETDKVHLSLGTGIKQLADSITVKL